MDYPTNQKVCATNIIDDCNDPLEPERPQTFVHGHDNEGML